MKAILLSLTMTFATITTLASTAQAEERDLAFFNAMLDAGVEVDSGMSKTYVSVSQIECASAPHNGWFLCSLTDNVPETSKRITVKGDVAQKISEAINQDARVSVKNGIVRQIHKGAICFQTNAGVYDEEVSEELRTHCNLDE